MTAAPELSGTGVMLDLATLREPGRLSQPAWLYGAARGPNGTLGVRRFLLTLATGSAVFPLGSDKCAFLLANCNAGATQLAIEPIAPDVAAIEVWYSGLLSCPGITLADPGAALVEAGSQLEMPAEARVTTRSPVWLKAPSPSLRYCGAVPVVENLSLLMLTEHVCAEAGEAIAVETLTTAEALARSSPHERQTLLSAIGQRLENQITAIETAGRQNDVQRDEFDRQEGQAALRRLDDIAAFRKPTASPVGMAHDSFWVALAVVAESEGVVLPEYIAGDEEEALFKRLEDASDRGNFRFREISLEGAWWRDEGPAMLAIDASSSEPKPLVWRRGAWRLIEGRTGQETPVDDALAAAFLPRGYMIYPNLPETLGPGSLRRFATFGMSRDAVRLVVAAISAALTGLLVPVATGAIIGAAAPDGRYDLLIDMMILLVAATIGGAGFQVVKAITVVRVGTHIDRRLQAAIWDRVMRLPTSFFRQYSVGDLAQRVLGIDAIRRILAGEAVTGMISGVFSIASLAIMLVYDRTLALYALGYAVVAALIVFALGRAQMRLQRIVYQRKGVVTSMLVEILGGISKLRIAGAEMRAFSRWANAFAEQRANDSRAGWLGALQTAALTGLPLLGALGAFAIAGGGSHPVAVGDFAAFNSAFGQLTAALLGLSASINLSIEAVPLFARVKPIFESPLEVGAGRDDPGRLAGHVAVRDVWFRYSPDGPWVLQGVDFEIRPGESLAIVGMSGSGKSTLLRLLLGFESPARGGIFYDGKDLEKLDLRRVRRQIGTVLETAGLVPGSIRENIVGSAPLSLDQIAAAVRLAGLEEDVAAMPMGLESFVMEGGGQISGGQRQRVMIARALVNRPRLVFFDQATSALDNRTQAIITKSLGELNATRLVIAHRLSTVRSADRILVLDDGRVAEAGTFDELIARAGAFRRLVERQML